MLGQISRPRLSLDEKEALLKGRVFSRQLAGIIAVSQGKSEAEIAQLARSCDMDPEALKTILKYHGLPLGIGSMSPGQLF